TSPEIVERFCAFFKARRHLVLPDGPLVAADITTLFVIAGMQPLMPYLRGTQVPHASRLVGLQRCLRTDDVEMVGTSGRKNSAFHMLGNWSIGDYGRRAAMELALELLGDLGVDRSRLWVTTFAGDQQLGLAPDEAAIEEWRRLGVPDVRIVPLGKDDNFW